MTTTQHMMDRFVVVGVVAAGLCAQPASTTKSRRGPQLKTLQYDVLTFYRRTCRWESQIWDCRKQVYVGEFFLLVQDIVGEVSEINQGVLGPIETLEFIRSKVCATVSDMLWGMPNLNMIPFMKIVSVAERSFFIGLALIHLVNLSAFYSQVIIITSNFPVM